MRKCNKNNVYDKYLLEINPIGINKRCIIIANSELLFEKYRMALKRDKDVIEIKKYDAIKRNQIFFDFMLIMFNHLNQLYVKEKILLIDTILKYKSRNESAKGVEKPNRNNNTRKGNKEDTSKPSTKKVVLWMRQTKQVEQEVTPTNKIWMQKQVHVLK